MRLLAITLVRVCSEKRMAIVWRLLTRFTRATLC